MKKEVSSTQERVRVKRELSVEWEGCLFYTLLCTRVRARVCLWVRAQGISTIQLCLFFVFVFFTFTAYLLSNKIHQHLAAGPKGIVLIFSSPPSTKKINILAHPSHECRKLAISDRQAIKSTFLEISHDRSEIKMSRAPPFSFSLNIYISYRIESTYICFNFQYITNYYLLKTHL